VRNVSILAAGEPVKFKQTGTRLVFKGLPETCPDKLANVVVFKIECDGRPYQVIGSYEAVVNYRVYDHSQILEVVRHSS